MCYNYSDNGVWLKETIELALLTFKVDLISKNLVQDSLKPPLVTNSSSCGVFTMNDRNKVVRRVVFSQKLNNIMQ